MVHKQYRPCLVPVDLSFLINVLSGNFPAILAQYNFALQVKIKMPAVYYRFNTWCWDSSSPPDLGPLTNSTCDLSD